jgi:hypothetical protein
VAAVPRSVVRRTDCYSFSTREATPQRVRRLFSSDNAPRRIGEGATLRSCAHASGSAAEGRTTGSDDELTQQDPHQGVPAGYDGLLDLRVAQLAPFLLPARHLKGPIMV